MKDDALAFLVASLVALGACGCRAEARCSATDPGPLFDGGQDFSALDRYLDGRLDDGLHGFAMQVVDAEGRVVYRREAGRCASSVCPAGDPGFTVQLVTGVASSSKWVTSTVVLAALDEGVAAGRWPSISDALETRVVAELGCGEVTGPVADVTLRHLLSFTSGLLHDHPCVSGNGALQACACEIVADSAAAMTTDGSPATGRRSAHPPGTTYEYGPSHHAVAGAWLERAFGEPWEQIFERTVRAPLGVDMRYARVTNLAGSIRTSVADYTRFVDALRADARGQGPRRLLSADALAEQRAAQVVREPPSVEWLVSPDADFDYGLNVWRWCAREPTEDEALGSTETLEGLWDPDCDEVFAFGHGGKGGYAPFVDASGRYAAVLSVREDSPGAGEDYTDEERATAARVRLLVHLAMTR